MNPLQSIIKNEMLQKGEIPFSRFMELCLYEPQFGYYSREKIKLGKSGDFFTNVHVSSIWGHLIAQKLKTIWSERGDNGGIIVEFGGGDGRLAEQILNALDTDRMRQNIKYIMIEKSAYHQKLQKERLQHFKQVTWIEQLEKSARIEYVNGSGIVIAHELLDAFPVDLLRRSNEGTWEQAYVGISNNNSSSTPFAWSWFDPDERNLEYVKLLGQEDRQPGKIMEICPQLPCWLEEINEMDWIRDLLVIDYGEIREQMDQFSSNGGTLRCYAQHQVDDHPLENVGEKDITADVDFTFLQKSAEMLGWELKTLMSQHQFCMEQNIFQFLKEHTEVDPWSEPAKTNRAVRQLLMSDMGMRFKVAHIEKKTSTLKNF